MNFITKPLSNTNVYSDKLQIVKSKKKFKRQMFSTTHQKAGSASCT